MRKVLKRDEGVLTVEACLCLTLFMFLILFLYSFFGIFEAQTKIQHTLLQAAQSMSLDAVASSNLNDQEKIKNLYDIAGVIGFKAQNDHPEFVAPEQWYDPSVPEFIDSIAKERFIAYFASGDEKKADEFLQALRVTNGISGLDFSKCEIDSEGNLNLSVTYTVEYMFDYKVFGMDPLTITSCASSKMWK